MASIQSRQTCSPSRCSGADKAVLPSCPWCPFSDTQTSFSLHDSDACKKWGERTCEGSSTLFPLHFIWCRCAFPGI